MIQPSTKQYWSATRSRSSWNDLVVHEAKPSGGKSAEELVFHGKSKKEKQRD